jgi:hypothetical protein
MWLPMYRWARLTTGERVKLTPIDLSIDADE